MARYLQPGPATTHPVRPAEVKADDHQGATPWAFARAVWAELVRLADYHDEAERQVRALRRGARRADTGQIRRER